VTDIWSGKQGGAQDDDRSSHQDDPDDLWAGRTAEHAVGDPGAAGADQRRPFGRLGRVGIASRRDPHSRREGDRGVSPRTRTTARVVLASLLVATLVVGGSVAFDLWHVRADLNESRVAVAELTVAIAGVDLDGASSAVEAAREPVRAAERRAVRPTWSLATFVPVVGPSVEVTREVVEVAAAAVDVADIAIADGRTLLTDGVALAVSDGQVDLTPIGIGAALFGRLPVDRLVAARDALAEPRGVWLPDEVLAGRAEVLALADDTVRTLERGEALVQALPGFLGAERPQRYFLAMQTPAEIRGTGGMIGFWGVLTVDDGRVVFGQSEPYDPFDTAGPPEGETRTARIRTIGLSPENPPDADPAFVERYAAAGAARNFVNINLDPDLPTSATAMLDLYELQTGERLDGVILLDPVALQRLLAVDGDPLPMDEDIAALFGYQDGLPIEDFARFVTADIYSQLGFGRGEERNELMRELGDAAFLRLLAGGWDGPPMVAAIADLTRERNLQIYVSDPEVQAGFDGVGATGSLHVDDRVDRFAVIANNAVGGKQDVHLGHRFAFDVELERIAELDDGSLVVDRTANVDVTVHNPLPSSGMDSYIIGSCYVPDGRNRCFEGEPGSNFTWFSLWASPATDVQWLRSDDGRGPDGLTKTFRDLRVVDHFHFTPASSTSGFALRLDGPAWLERTQDAVVYDFEWWRQSKAIPDHLEVVIAPPRGWAVGRVELTGGGSGSGMGVFGEGEPLDVEVVDGVVGLRGTVTADTRVRVHLVDPATMDGEVPVVLAGGVE